MGAITISRVALDWELSAWDVRVYLASIWYSHFYLICYDENRMFLPARTDPRVHQNWKHFEGAVRNSDKMNTSVYRYFQVLFYRLQDDRHDWRVYPVMLTTAWAINRYAALFSVIPQQQTARSEAQGYLESVRVGRHFLQRVMKSINQNWEYPRDLEKVLRYSKSNALQPLCLTWIDQGALTRAYIALSFEFYRVYHSLPHDLKIEYVDEIELDNINKRMINLIPSGELQTAAGTQQIMNRSMWNVG